MTTQHDTPTFGRFFEDFNIGDTYRNWPGRTISEADDTWFSLLTQNQNPVHIDANYAAEHTEHGKCLVNGILVFAIVIGQCVQSVSGRAIAALEYESVTHEAPTFHGDTIYSETRVIDKWESSKGDRGIVQLNAYGFNQRSERVISIRRKVLVPKRNHPTLGAHVTLAGSST